MKLFLQLQIHEIATENTFSFSKSEKIKRNTRQKLPQSHENQQTFPCYDTLYSIQVGVLRDECTKD